MKKIIIILLIILFLFFGLVWEHRLQTQPSLSAKPSASDAVLTAKGYGSPTVPSQSQNNSFPSSSPKVQTASTASTILLTRGQSQNTLRANGLTANTGSRADPSISPLKEKTDAERWAWWHQMQKKDTHFEYKMPISFYGKILDDQGGPVEGAKAELVWMDLSEDGTSKTIVLSNAQGLFSLEGATGKQLSVQVSKDGYKPDTTKNRYDFEYSRFMEPHFYDPDPSDPVVFYLRKNQSAEYLVKTSVRLSPQINRPVILNLAGRNARTNQAQVVYELLENQGPRNPVWSARLTVPGGGHPADYRGIPV